MMYQDKMKGFCFYFVLPFFLRVIKQSLLLGSLTSEKSQTYLQRFSGTDFAFANMYFMPYPQVCNLHRVLSLIHHYLKSKPYKMNIL